MFPADEIQRVCEGLWCWSRYQAAVKVECSSVAVRTSAGLVFIDPIPLTEEALAELTQFGEPAAIIVTNANHDRGVQKLREAFQIPVLAHAEAAPALGFAVDRTVAEGDVIFGTLTVFALPGAVAGEIALHDSRGWMLVGDAIINLEPDGLALLPEKYCVDGREMRASLRKLLRFPIEVLTFAHGLPLVSQARSRLELLLA